MSAIGHVFLALRRRAWLSFAVSFAVVGLAVAAACPQSPSPAPAAPETLGGRMSSSLLPRSFASTVGKQLSTNEFKAFIHGVDAVDRSDTAVHLMSAMDPNQRGDFAVLRPDGSVWSNRADYHGIITRTVIPLVNDFALHGSNYPPGEFGGAGPYVREYSRHGILATVAYVTVACRDTRFANDDTGFLYTGAVGERGSQIDAGLQYSNDQTVQPFVRVSSQLLPTAVWRNEWQNYRCGDHLAMMFGTVPGIVPHKLFLATGIVPSAPLMSVGKDVWHDASWVFFDAPADFNDPGTDSSGAPTSCRLCYTKRMTSIGQTHENVFDGTCFGGCLPTVPRGISWDLIAMGQIPDTCADGSNCKMAFQADSDWYGGLQTYAGNNQGGVRVTEGRTTASEGFTLARVQQYP